MRAATKCAAAAVGHVGRLCAALVIHMVSGQKRICLPVKVERPEGHNSQDLDLPELDRRPPKNVIYHCCSLSQLLLSRVFQLSSLLLRDVVRTESSRSDVMNAVF